MTNTPLLLTSYIGPENRTHVLSVFNTEQSPQSLNECLKVKLCLVKFIPGVAKLKTYNYGERKMRNPKTLVPFGSQVPTKHCLQSKAHECTGPSRSPDTRQKRGTHSRKPEPVSPSSHSLTKSQARHLKPFIQAFLSQLSRAQLGDMTGRV